MTNPELLDVLGLILLVVVIIHAASLHLRISRLRRALDEAGQVLPSLDAAVARMDGAAGGFARRVQTDLESIDQRIANAKRIASELSMASRAADDLAAQLDRQMRQSRRQEVRNAEPTPRELVEPKGFAKRLGAVAAELSRSASVIAAPAYPHPVTQLSFPPRPDNTFAPRPEAAFAARPDNVFPPRPDTPFPPRPGNAFTPRPDTSLPPRTNAPAETPEPLVRVNMI